MDTSKSDNPGQQISNLYQQNIRALGNRDIIVASYGGAGQALLGNILLELGLNYVDPYTEALLPNGSSAGVAPHTGYRRRLAATHRSDFSTREAGPPRQWPRFAKTHFPPKTFGRCDGLRGVWILVRDPRDAIYSWYRWRLNFAEEAWDTVEGSFEDFLRKPDHSGRPPLDDWSSFYRNWLQHTEHSTGTSILRFEDLKQTPFQTVRVALETVGVDVATEELRQAVDRSTFESMRAHEDSVAEADSDRSSEARIMRAGKVEGWRNWITPKLSRYFVGEELSSIARRFGYTIPKTADTSSEHSSAGQ